MSHDWKDIQNIFDKFEDRTEFYSDEYRNAMGKFDVTGLPPDHLMHDKRRKAKIHHKKMIRLSEKTLEKKLKEEYNV